jgi:hypothetical protein
VIVAIARDHASVGQTPVATPPKQIELRFGGVTWRLEGPVPIGPTHEAGEWEYRPGAKLKGMRVVERRDWEGSPRGYTNWSTFSRGRLVARYMQVQNPTTKKWVMHGLDVRYHDDGTIGYGVWWVGEVAKTLDVSIPPPAFVWEPDWNPPAGD